MFSFLMLCTLNTDSSILERFALFVQRNCSFFSCIGCYFSYCQTICYNICPLLEMVLGAEICAKNPKNTSTAIAQTNRQERAPTQFLCQFVWPTVAKMLAEIAPGFVANGCDFFWPAPNSRVGFPVYLVKCRGPFSSVVLSLSSSSPFAPVSQFVLLTVCTGSVFQFVRSLVVETALWPACFPTCVASRHGNRLAAVRCVCRVVCLAGCI